MMTVSFYGKIWGERRHSLASLAKDAHKLKDIPYKTRDLPYMTDFFDIGYVLKFSERIALNKRVLRNASALEWECVALAAIAVGRKENKEGAKI